MTPLFPEINAPITIKQGNAGNCFLLSSLDCILNQGNDGRYLIQSLFTELGDGSISVRIKRSEQSVNLDPRKLLGKYGYFTNGYEDVFILSPERLQHIDKDSNSVVSNSLAVKILERISSYYFLNTDDFIDYYDSIAAHNRGSQKYQTTSTMFVSKLLSIPIWEINNIDELIRFKMIYPQACVYLSLEYRLSDVFGVVHNRHALRVESISANAHESYDFILVNPWDNQQQPISSLEKIKELSARVCIFIKDGRKHQLVCKLINGAVEDGASIMNNKKLFDFFIYLQDAYPYFNHHHIQLLTTLHTHFPEFLNYITYSSSYEHTTLLECINASANLENLISALLIKMPNFNYLELLLKQYSSYQNIGTCIKNVALIAKSYDYFSLTSLFASDQFFSLIINTAIAHKTVLLAGDKACAQQQIESGLVQFYFNDNPLGITSSAHLRDYFVGQIFSFTSIEHYFNAMAAQFLMHATAHFFLGTQVLPALMHYIENANYSLFNPQTFSELMDVTGCFSEQQFKSYLKKMEVVNPEFSKALQSLAVNHPVYEEPELSKPIAPENWGLFNTRIIMATPNNDTVNKKTLDLASAEPSLHLFNQ